MMPPLRRPFRKQNEQDVQDNWVVREREGKKYHQNDNNRPRTRSYVNSMDSIQDDNNIHINKDTQIENKQQELLIKDNKKLFIMNREASSSNPSRRSHGRSAPLLIDDYISSNLIDTLCIIAEKNYQLSNYLLVNNHGKIILSEPVIYNNNDNNTDKNSLANLVKYSSNIPLPTSSSSTNIDINKNEDENENEVIKSNLSLNIIPNGSGIIIPTLNMFLCNNSISHYHTSHIDRSYGCGYRNTQMILSVLMSDSKIKDYIQNKIKLYSKSYNLKNNKNNQNNVPNVIVLQELIESAWKEGFDSAGANQLGYKVKDTRKWIGTTEVACLFLLLGIRIEIHDFHKPIIGWNKLFDLVENYFKSNINENDKKEDINKGVYNINISPLYLQHNGHSRTIIGIEKLVNGSRNLLVYDPAKQFNKEFITLSNKINENNQNKLNSNSNNNNDNNKVYQGCNLLYNKNEDIIKDITPIDINRMLNFFRLDENKISQNDQYQILIIKNIDNWKNEKDKEEAKMLTSILETI